MIAYSVLLIFSLFAAFFDFLFYRIPNIFVFWIVVFFIPVLITIHNWSHILHILAISGIILAFSFVFHLFKWIGAGDAKFLFASSLWAVHVDIVGFLFIMALAGGGISLIYIAFSPKIDSLRLKFISIIKKKLPKNSLFKKYTNQPFISSSAESFKQIKIPYGLAICIANIFVFISLYRG